MRLVRTSERGTFQECRWKWNLAYNKKLKARAETPALRFGTLVHKALELRYPPGKRRGPHPAKSFVRLFDAELKEVERSWGFRDEDGKWADARETGIDMMEHFVDKYGRESHVDVIASEMRFNVPVVYKNRTLFHYVGTMDLVYRNRDTGAVRIRDYKTTSKDPTKVAHLVLDEQGTSYWTWGVDYLVQEGLIKPEEFESLDGMEFFFMRKAKRDERPQDESGQYLNKDGSVSKNQPSPYFHIEPLYRGQSERVKARQRAIQEFIEMEKCRQGKSPIYKRPGFGSMSHCNFCPFADPCELHETGSDWRSLIKVTTERWDPYADHVIESEGKE